MLSIEDEIVDHWLILTVLNYKNMTGRRVALIVVDLFDFVKRIGIDGIKYAGGCALFKS